jgi:molybdate transport system ATP-binding protein
VQNLLPCVVDALTPDTHPSQMLVRLVCQGTPVLARVTARAVHDLALQPGLPVWAQVKAVALLG